MSMRYSRNKDGGKIVAQRVRSARGFTLIELVIVIGLILVLVGLTMAVGLAVRAQSETRQTENVLILLDQAVKQWEIAADRQLSWGTEDLPVDGAVYDINDQNFADVQLTQLLGRISTNQSARDILAQIDDDFLQQEEGGLKLKLVDPWGSPVHLIHPGTVDPVNAVDPDGTIRVSVDLFGDRGHEDIYGVARNRQLLFVSAGPDGEFGNLSADPDSDDFKQTQDNVYSYQPGSIERVP